MINKKPAGNSRFKKWRKMCKIHIFLSQEFLSLTENIPLRSSPLHEAAERWGAIPEGNAPTSGHSAQLDVKRKRLRLAPSCYR
jgi:hypothetical protein